MKQRQQPIELIHHISECHACLNLPIAIAYTDTKLNIVETNLQFIAQYGYTQEQQTLTMILNHSANVKTKLAQQWLDRIKQLNFITCEVATRHKNGTPGWTYLRGKLFNRQNPALGFIWTLDDITELKTAQEHLQLTDLVFQTSSEGMLIFDEQARIETLNPALENLTGYPTATLIQQPVAVLFSARQQAQTLANALNQVRQHKQWRGELWLNKKNHQQIPVLVTLNGTEHADGSVANFIALVVDISAHNAEKKELRHRADHDPLTGLANRNKFFERLNEALALADRHKYSIALFYLDLDGFKPINDVLGHGKGDQVLQEVADKLKDCVRETDTVARLGGDEFAIIFNGTSEELINTTARRLIQSVSMHLDGSLKLSVSIGISLFPNDSVNPLKLLQYADQAMYKAKESTESYCWYNRVKHYHAKY